MLDKILNVEDIKNNIKKNIEFHNSVDGRVESTAKEIQEEFKDHYKSNYRSDFNYIVECGEQDTPKVRELYQAHSEGKELYEASCKKIPFVTSQYRDYRYVSISQEVLKEYFETEFTKKLETLLLSKGYKVRYKPWALHYEGIIGCVLEVTV